MSKKFMLTVILIFIQLLLPTTCKAINNDLRNIPLYKKRVYNQIEFLEVNGYINPILDGAKPLSYGDLRNVITELKLKPVNKVERMVINSLLTELKGGISLVELGDKEINLDGNFVIRYPSNLILANKIDQSGQIGDESHYILYSKTWFQPYPFLFGETGIRLHQGSSQKAAHIPPAYTKVALGAVNFELGEDSIRWGPGYFGSLSLAGDSRSPMALGFNEWFLDNPELDIFRAVIDSNNFKVTYFTARDGAEWGQFAAPRPDEPFLSGLRTDIKLGKYLTIGAGDIAVSYEPFEFGLLIKDPLAYFTDSYDSPQSQRGENLNLMGTCDFTATIPNVGRVHGEYIWDSTLSKEDLSKYNAASAGAKTGFLLGAYLPFETESAIYEMRVEHAVIEDTVYTFPLDSDLSYKYKDKWLGHWAGPDSESTIVELSTQRLDDWEGAVRFINIHRGVNLAPERKLRIVTMEAAKNINENFKVVGYLQHSYGDIEDSMEKNGFGFELQFDL